MLSGYPPKIDANPTLDPKISFLVLPSAPVSLDGLLSQSGSSKHAKKQPWALEMTAAPPIMGNSENVNGTYIWTPARQYKLQQKN